MFKIRLRSARINRGKTQQFMADNLNVALRTYQTYEGGTREPSINTLIKIADLLEVSIDYLFGRDNYVHLDEVSSDEC